MANEKSFTVDHHSSTVMSKLNR